MHEYEYRHRTHHLTSVLLLKVADHAKPYILQMDASDWDLGTVLSRNERRERSILLLLPVASSCPE